MGQELVAWRNGRQVALLTKTQKGVNIEYASGVADGISLSLPVGTSLGEQLPFAWMRNILPTNEAVLHTLAKEHNVPNEPFSLLSKIGEDIAGDISLLPRNVTPLTSKGRLVQVRDEEIAFEISRIKASRVSKQISFGGRLSLGGAQSKFSLSQQNGNWYKTTVSVPSTHIFKPGNNQFPHIEAAESAAMELARLVGVRTAFGGVYSVSGETSYITERFDRFRYNGMIYRRQIEDLGQINSLLPNKMYHTNFKSMLFKLREVGLVENEVYELVKQVVFNVHIGNMDAHIKNYSLMKLETGLIVSPLYDSIPYMYYGKSVKSKLAMPIGGAEQPQQITMKNWVTWAESANLDVSLVSEIANVVVLGIREKVKSTFERWGLEDRFRRSVLFANSGL